MDIQVGDKVTYIDKQGKKCIVIVLEDKGEISDSKDNLIKEIIKVERPKYEVVEEKKELLTEEEKEFLKQYIKIIEELNNGKVGRIIREVEDIHVVLENGLTYKVEIGIKFGNMKVNNEYTLKELGLEEN